MSDERFDDAIRDALLADDPGPVPVRLRARMAMIPDETAPRQATGGWRQRLIAVAVPAAVLAAVAIVAVVLGGIAMRGQQAASVLPTVLPSAPPASAQTSAPSASPSPSGSSSPSTAPTGPITILPSQVTPLTPGAFALNDGVWYVRSPFGTASYPTLLANGPGGGWVLVELKNGHDIASYALTDAGIVWIETWYAEPAVDCAGRVPCSPHEYQPVSWALNLTTFDGKTTTRLDNGVVSRISVQGEGASPLPPEMAAQGGRVAYAVPRAHVPGAPEASQILIRTLPDGTLVRKIDTDGYVAQLGVFGQAIVFRDALDSAGAGSVDASDATLYATTSDAQEPSALATHVADVAIGDGGVVGPIRVAWATNDQNSASVHVVFPAEGNSTVVEATAGTSGPASQIVIVGDGVVWIAQTQDSAGAWSSVVNAWHPAWGSGRAVSSLGSPDTIGATGDQLLVTGGSAALLSGLATETGAIPASALFGPTP